MSRRLVLSALLLLAAACAAPTEPTSAPAVEVAPASLLNTTAPTDTTQRGGYVLPH